MRTTLGLLLASALLLSSLSCAGRSEIRGVETTGLDRKLGTFSFIEEGDLVSFIVNARATRYREEDAFFPLEICVANRGLKNLTLTRESFILIDEEGNRYHVVPPRDLIESYRFLDLDRELAELEGIVFNRFAAFTRYFSNFSPTRLGRANASTVVKDRVTLPRFGYFIDFVYFPRPQTGVKEHRFELHMEAPELPHPIFVKFIVL